MLSRLVSFLLIGAACAAPSLAAAQSVGQPVTLAWDASSASTLIGYRVYVGTHPGNYSRSFQLGTVTTFTYRDGIAGTRYYFAVSALASGSVESPRSAEVSTVVAVSTGVSTGSTGPTPTTPVGDALILQAPVMAGSTVTLSWSPVGTLDVAEYLLEAGSSSGLSNLYNGSVGTVTSLSATVGGGTYFVRVRARTSANTSAVSNEVSFSAGTGGCTTAPQTPTGVSGTVVDGVAMISWTAASGATSYVVQAGSAPSLSDIFHGDVGDSHLVSAVVESGFRAHIRVVAVNACGQSAASSEIIVR